MFREFFSYLFHNYYQAAAMIVFGIGFVTLLVSPNLIKKVIGFYLMNTAAFLFLVSKGFIRGRLAPIAISDPAVAEDYVNPLPAAPVLIGVVLTVSFNALFLALTVHLYKSYHTLNIYEINRLMRREQDGKEG